MAKLDILAYPHPFLKTKASPVTLFDHRLTQLAEDMIETMYEDRGIGLAAVQVGENKRMIVVDVQANEENVPGNPYIMINPEILRGEGEQTCEEGCLSVPEFRAEVKRYATIELQYIDLEQKTHTMKLSGIFAVCVQHEIDHLNGILFIDHLPPIKRRMIRARLKKLAKEYA